ncbi:hypothetical protein G6F68_020816 [Rhizopus microsporus]|nr:hypothetical protein G6F68_020816 [Rhizopus microsporus]
MMPVEYDPDMPCSGQSFALLEPISVRILAESFGTPSRLVNQRFRALGMMGDEHIQPGSRICLTNSLFKKSNTVPNGPMRNCGIFQEYAVGAPCSTGYV